MDMDAVDLLIEQHRALENLFSDAVAAATSKQRQAMFDRIADDIALHIAVEEQLFYPAVKAHWTEYDLLLSLEEHLSLKRLIADLLALDADDSTFVAKFKVMTDQAIHHHRLEEDYLFPKVRELIAEPARRQLGAEMQALQAELGRQPRPRAALAEETDAAAPLP